MERKINYLPNMPIAWKKKRGRSIFFKIIIAILVLIVLSLFGFQLFDANTMISEIKDVNPEINIYYLGKYSPSVFLKTKLWQRVIKTNDIFTFSQDIRAGDIIVISDDIIEENKQNSDLTKEFTRLLENGTSIAIFSGSILPWNWQSIFAIRQNTIIDNEEIYYIYQDNSGEITYLRHIEEPFSIKALKEAKLLSQIVEKRTDLIK